VPNGSHAKPICGSKFSLGWVGQEANGVVKDAYHLDYVSKGYSALPPVGSASNLFLGRIVAIPARLPAANPLADAASLLPRKELQGSDTAQRVCETFTGGMLVCVKSSRITTGGPDGRHQCSPPFDSMHEAGTLAVGVIQRSYGDFVNDRVTRIRPRL
jgi:hypothetical protein